VHAEFRPDHWFPPTLSEPQKPSWGTRDDDVLPAIVGHAYSQKPHQFRGLAFGEAGLLVPAHESLHFLKGNGAIVVGIHRLEYALVSRLKLLQCL
jgi:hypothetical protein